MTMAQLSGRSSLRDIIDNASAQAHRLYHLSSAKLSRSNLHLAVSCRFPFFRELPLPTLKRPSLPPLGIICAVKKIDIFGQEMIPLF